MDDAARVALALVLVLAPACLTGCLVDHGEPKLSETTLEAVSVSEEGGGSSCSPTVVRGLAEQLVAEANCMQPGTYRRISSIPRVSLTSGAASAPYLQRDAATALARAAQRGSETITINSGLRTVAQQYLLRRWAERGRCGISAAAAPGRSNHESGLAIDVSDYTTWRARLEAEGFRWYGSRDRVHFDYTGGTDLRRVSVRAFQRLWNRNHPEDRIAEDGDYGADTESRLRRAPVEGFPRGASCGAADSGGGTDSPAPLPTPHPADPDAGVAPPPPTSSASICAGGMGCAGCNAIAEECGFCASTGACLEGDAAGPIDGACGAGWQWLAPSACPATDPVPTTDACGAHTTCGECTAPGLGCGYCGDTGACMRGSSAGPVGGFCGDWAWSGAACGGSSVPTPAPTPTPGPMCIEVRGACASGGTCCAGSSCRSGVSYGVRCCAESGTACAGGGDCCGYMDCVSGTCTCRGAGRACLADGDCCSSSCVSGRCS